MIEKLVDMPDYPAFHLELFLAVKVAQDVTLSCNLCISKVIQGYFTDSSSMFQSYNDASSILLYASKMPQEGFKDFI